MGKLTETQLKIAEQILIDGKASLSKESSHDYCEAAAFVFDNGLFFFREHSLEVVRAALTKGSENSHE